MTASGLFDIRTPLWRAGFEAGVSFEAFLASGAPAHGERWRGHREKIKLTAAQSELVSSFTRHMNVLVLAGTWCGDCARQGPMLEAIAAASTRINLRFIDSQAIPQLRDELRIHGAARVPVAVSLSEDFFEVGRSGDRQLAAYRRKAQSELGGACDAGIIPPSAEDLAEEVAQWVEHFERQQLLLRVSPFLRKRHND